MWATGCIVGEMYHGKPVLPGSSTPDQLARVAAVLGPPTPADLEAIGVAATACATAAGPAPPFAPAFLDAAPDARAARPLVASLLRYAPRDRATAARALEDAWVADFHRSEEEPPYPDGPARLAIDDDVLLSPADYRDRLTLEIAKKTRRDPRILSRLEIGTCAEAAEAPPPPPENAEAAPPRPPPRPRSPPTPDVPAGPPKPPKRGGK